MGGFFGNGMAMEGLAKVQVHVLFYILRKGGNILNRDKTVKSWGYLVRPILQLVSISLGLAMIL